MQKNVKPNDIVHVHLFPPILYVSLLRMIAHFPCHLVCTEHSTFNHRRGTFLGNILDTIIYPGYEQVIAISEGVKQELLNWRPGLKGKTRVIHNGVPLYFQSVLRRRPKARLKVLSIGNLRPAKNYDNALKAVALLGDLDFEYQIAGKGECRRSLLQLCEQLGIQSKVQFLGYAETVLELLASADIFLMPSRWEGFGLAAVEAMNAGLPLVVSNVTGLQEIVRGDSTCAVLVDPDSPEAIAEGLRQLINFRELRLQLGENAFRNAQKFNNDQMVEKHLSLYAELIDS
jgi:glycosyltransferase involved in cell wall biosynthesis